MKLLNTFALALIAFTSNAQWVLIKNFNKPLTFIQSTQQGIVVSTDADYYIQQDPSYQTWSSFTLNGERIVDMTSNGSTIYLATPKSIYEHSTSPIKIQELTGKDVFTQLSLYKGEKLVCINSTLFCTFNTAFAAFDTLDYPTTEYRYYLNTMSSYDTLALIGYDNYYGALTYESKIKKWIGLSPLETEVVWDSYVKNGIIMARYKKGGTGFYISHNNGKSFQTNPNAFDFNYTRGSLMEYSNGNAFVGLNSDFYKGLFQSTDDGKTWNNILPDSAITGLAINGNDLFATTANGCLLKKSISQMTTGVTKNLVDSELGFYYSNGIIYNRTQEKINLLIFDLSGKQVAATIIEANSQKNQPLNPGLYVITSLHEGNTKQIKISVL